MKHQELHLLQKAGFIKQEIEKQTGLQNLIQTGSIIIFDDWFNYKGDPLKGEQLACKEWLNKNKIEKRNKKNPSL